MKQTELRERLNAIRIFNTWDLLKHFGEKRKTDVVVGFRGTGPPRTMEVHGTRVWSPSHKIDPEGAYYDNGAKTFLGKRPESFPKAMAWAQEKYPKVTQWVTCPFDRSAKVPVDVVKAATAKVLA